MNECEICGGEFRAVIFNAARENKLDRLKIFLDEPRTSDWLNDCLNNPNNVNIPLVIAARYGFLEVCQYLVSKGADVKVRGTVSFDGEIIAQAPALWAASAAGFIDVVKFLVLEAGAEINQTTATNSTPLRGACYDGHMDIVEFLVKHGADIEIANRHGHTPLMIACFRGKTDVTKYLLERGANIQKQSHKGNTALHDAAEGDREEICEMLINAGAQLQEDDNGMCPLMSSAILGNEKTLPLLMPICPSHLKRRDALKVLGCTLCDKKMNMHGAVEAWKRAVEISISGEDKSTGSTPFVVAEVYGDIKEVETMEEVVAIEGQPDLIHMQSLLIRERILGGGHTDVHYYIRFRGAVYCDLGRVIKCFDLWMHALRLQQLHLTPLHMSTIATFQAFQETYSMAANEHRIHQEAGRQQWPVKTEQVFELIEMLCHELERLSEWPADKPLQDECCEAHEHDLETEKDRLALISLHLILLVKRLNIVEPIPNVDVRRLIRICQKLEILPLHLALQESTDRVDPQFKDALPSLYVTNQLIQSGADVDSSDEYGNTPLHVLLLNERPRESIVRLLLDSGAPILARNDEDNTCLDLMELSNLKNIQCGRYISLMGLAANAVMRSGDSRLGLDILPKDLHRFFLHH